MGIPDFQTVMLPILEAIGDGQEHHIQQITQRVSDRFNLTDDERTQKLPSGQQTIIGNRVAWAKAHMKMAGLIDSPRRGYVKITTLGGETLNSRPERIDLRYLRKFPKYVEWTKQAPTNGTVAGSEEAEENQTPRERIESAYKTLRSTLAAELLDRLKSSNWQFFEEVVVRLLVAMGYGGSLADAGQRIGKAGDGGIDGIIKEDRLGLDLVCIQAKRWDATVGRPVVQAFVGSMDYYRSRKGVLISTSNFSADAKDYVGKIEGKKVVLIDGETLADLMIEYDIGVTVSETYKIKRVDHDFFEEEKD